MVTLPWADGVIDTGNAAHALWSLWPMPAVLDTTALRAMALQVGLAYVATLPWPSGSLVRSARAHALSTYDDAVAAATQLIGEHVVLEAQGTF